MKKWLLVALVTLLAACGPRISGTYTDPMGLTSFTFKSGDKVAMTTMGIETELNYTVDDSKVKIGSEKGAMVLTILEDGSLKGPVGIKFTKKQE